MISHPSNAYSRAVIRSLSFQVPVTDCGFALILL
jgi:hypothetical protein